MTKNKLSCLGYAIGLIVFVSAAIILSAWMIMRSPSLELRHVPLIIIVTAISAAAVAEIVCLLREFFKKD